MNKIENEKILFIIGSFTIGGIQSNFLRVFSELSKHKDIHVLILTDKVDFDMFQKLELLVKVVRYDLISLISKTKYCNRCSINHSLPLSPSKIKRQFNGISVIHAVESETLYTGYIVAKYLGARLTVGCYHPREFTWKTKSNFYFRRIQNYILESLSPKNIVYMNEDCATLTQNDKGGRFYSTNPVIIPLSIIKPTRLIKADKNSIKLVSVGRLVSFKSYNEVLIRIIDEVNHITGRDFEYHIYGTGPEEKKLKELAKIVKAKVIFHGDLDYSKFPEVLEGAFAFIGIGSSLLESASFGIPSIYGIDSEIRDLTYGLFSDVPGANVGEQDPKLPRKKISKLIYQLSILNDHEYDELCKKERHATKPFLVSSISNQWEVFFDNSQPLKNGIRFSKIHYFFSSLLWNGLNLIGVLDDRATRY